MVVINHCIPHQLKSYATVPLAQSVAASVQQNFTVSSFARVGNPTVTISIQDRPDFYGASHYSIRETLDGEGFLIEFLVIDDRTADSHAIWHVETTENSKEYTAIAVGGEDAPITHPDEFDSLANSHVCVRRLDLMDVL